MYEWLVMGLFFIALCYVIEYFFKDAINEISFLKLLILWFLVNALDAHSTFLFVNDIGPDIEGNPIYNYLIREFGVARGLYIKALLTLVFGAIFFFFERSVSNKILFFCLSICIGLVSIWNYTVPHTIGWWLTTPL